MNKKCFIAGFVLLFLILSAGILLYSRRPDQNEEETSEPQAMETEKSVRGDEQGEKSGSSDEEFEKEKSYGESVNDEVQIEETEKEEGAEKEEIELMDYVELDIEEFMKETGIHLFQDKEEQTIWATDDDVIRVYTDGGKIVGLGMDGILCEEKSKELIKKEGYPYTLAGISLNDQISYIEETVLRDACHDEGMLHEEFYSSLYLSKLGIETLQVIHDGDKIGMLSTRFDQSLKDNSEHLEYIWTDRIRHKEGTKNDKLEAVQEPYAHMPGGYQGSENIEKTVVWIKYPTLEIPGEPEMTENANAVIQEAVKKIEDNTYKKTDKNIVVTADYKIDYISGEFISISFDVYVDEETVEWQFCNINISRNGEKAYLADWGITKEKVAKECFLSEELDEEDVEEYLKNYDANWDKYTMFIRRCVVFVKDPDQESELCASKDWERSVRWYRE